MRHFTKSMFEWNSSVLAFRDSVPAKKLLQRAHAHRETLKQHGFDKARNLLNLLAMCDTSSCKQVAMVSPAWSFQWLTRFAYPGHSHRVRGGGPSPNVMSIFGYLPRQNVRNTFFHHFLIRQKCTFLRSTVFSFLCVCGVVRKCNLHLSRSHLNGNLHSRAAANHSEPSKL